MRPAMLLVVGLFLAGCGDSAYYQTRATPEGGSDFGFMSWLFHSEDDDVYELPARPPAISTATEDNHLARKDCARPAQRIKENGLATMETTSTVRTDTTGAIALVSMDDDEHPRSQAQQVPLAIAGWQDAKEPGARELQGVRPLAGLENKPRSTPGSGLDRAHPVALAGSAEPDGYCP